MRPSWLPQSIRIPPPSLSAQFTAALAAENECKRLQIWLATVFSSTLFVTDISLRASPECYVLADPLARST
jgi:hypothetical protein